MSRNGNGPRNGPGPGPKNKYSFLAPKQLSGPPVNESRPLENGRNGPASGAGAPEAPSIIRISDIPSPTEEEVLSLERDTQRHALILKPEDPRLKEIDELQIYGLSGAPLTTAHYTITLLLAKHYLLTKPKSMFVLIPASNRHTKPAVQCSNGYLWNNTDFRVALQLEMALIIHNFFMRKYGRSNILVSLHEQNKPTSTYDRIQDLKVYGKPLRLIWGADSVKDILNRRWNKAKLLADEIGDGTLKAGFLPREDIPYSSLKAIAMGPVSTSSLYGNAAQDRSPFSEPEATEIV